MKCLAPIAGMLLIALSAGSPSAFAAPPSITAGDPPVGTVGQPYLYDFDIKPTPSEFGASNAPPGLSFNPSDDSLAGTPDTAGTFDTVLFARNAEAEETRITRRIVINPAPVPEDLVQPTIAITNMVIRKLGGVNNYEFTFFFFAADNQALASPALEYRGAVNHEALDAWKPYPYLGPTEPFVVGLSCRAFEFEVRAVDQAGNRSVAANRKFEAPGSSTRPVITSAASAKGKVRKAFLYRIKAAGATRYSASGLPPGCKVNRLSGEISGRPTRAGTFSVRITAANAAGTTKKTVRIKIARR